MNFTPAFQQFLPASNWTNFSTSLKASICSLFKWGYSMCHYDFCEDWLILNEKMHLMQLNMLFGIYKKAYQKAISGVPGHLSWLGV